MEEQQINSETNSSVDLVYEIWTLVLLCLRVDTCGGIVTSLVHPANEKLQSDDSIDDDDKHDQHTNVQQRDHGFHDGVQHNL